MSYQVKFNWYKILMKFKSLYTYLLNWTNVNRSISIRFASNPGRNNRGSCKRKPLSTGVPLRFGPVFAYGHPEGEWHHRIRYISILEGLVLPFSPPVYKSRLSSLGSLIDSYFSLRNLFTEKWISRNIRIVMVIG